MRLIAHGSGFLAIQKHLDSRGPVNVAGYGETRLQAMSACGSLLSSILEGSKP